MFSAAVVIGALRVSNETDTEIRNFEIGYFKSTKMNCSMPSRSSQCIFIGFIVEKKKKKKKRFYMKA